MIWILTSDLGNGGGRETDEAKEKVKATSKDLLSAKPRTESTSAPRTVAELTGPQYQVSRFSIHYDHSSIQIFFQEDSAYTSSKHG